MISNIFKVAVLVAATFLTSCAGEVCNCEKDESSSVYVEHPWSGGRIAYFRTGGVEFAAHILDILLDRGTLFERFFEGFHAV